MRGHPIDMFGIPQQGRNAAVPRFNYNCRRLNSHTLVVETPILDYTDTGTDDEQIREALSKRDDGEVVMNAFDNAFNNYKEHHKGTGKMHWHLIFPNSGTGQVDLDETVLAVHEGKTNGEMKAENLMVSHTIDRLQRYHQFEETRTIQDPTNKNNEIKVLVEVREVFYHAAPCQFWRIADKNRIVEKRGRGEEEQEETDDDFAAQFLKG